MRTPKQEIMMTHAKPSPFRTSMFAAILVAAGLMLSVPASADGIGNEARDLVHASRQALYAGNIDLGIELSQQALDYGLGAADQILAATNLCIGHAVKGDTATAIGYCQTATGEPRDAWSIYTARARVKYVKRAFENSLSE